jgi:catechol 2,3-dioxygenase-like lactoylglutathione lyase family enzyme
MGEDHGDGRGVGFWHLGLTVSDVDRSLGFYRDVVGMRLEQLKDHVNADFDRLSDNRGTAVRVAWLSDGLLILQLIQYLRGGDGALSLQHNRVGSPHLSFFVDDVDDMFARVTASGDITTLTDGPVPMGAHARSFYALDPDGLPVEFWQWTEASMVGRRITP